MGGPEAAGLVAMAGPAPEAGVAGAAAAGALGLAPGSAPLQDANNPAARPLISTTVQRVNRGGIEGMALGAHKLTGYFIMGVLYKYTLRKEATQSDTKG